MLSRLLLLWLGGGLGTLARYGVGMVLHYGLGTGFPYGTLCVNVLGCFVIGVLAQQLEPTAHANLRLFLMTGVLGGFTTFSAFGLETVGLLKAGSYGLAVAYVLGSVGLGLVAVLAGLWLSRSWLL